MICIAFICTIIASRVEDGNIKCSYNSWVTGFLPRVEYIHDVSTRC